MEKLDEFLSSGTRHQVSFAEVEQQQDESAVEIHLRQMKIESELLSRKAELMEKNMLLYRSYELLSKIESDYFQDDNTNATNWKDTTATDDVLSLEFEKFALEQQMKRVQMENKELREKLDKEITKSKKIGEQLQSQSLQKHTSLDTLAQKLQSLIQTLEQENISLKAELKLLKENLDVHSDDSEMEDKIQKMKNTLIEKFKDLEVKDEMIRARNQQIQQYDSYIKKLHLEIKNWLGHDNDDILNEDASIVPVFESHEIKLQKHAQLVSQLVRLKQELEDSRRKEMELKSENRMLEGTLQSLSSNIEGIIRNYDTEFQGIQSTSPSTEIGRYEYGDKEKEDFGILESKGNEKYAYGDSCEIKGEHFSEQKINESMYSSGSDGYGDI